MKKLIYLILFLLIQPYLYGNIIDNLNSYPANDTLSKYGKWKTTAPADRRYIIAESGGNRYASAPLSWKSSYSAYYDSTVTTAFNFAVRMVGITGLSYIKINVTVNQVEFPGLDNQGGYCLYYYIWSGAVDTLMAVRRGASDIILAKLAREMSVGDTLAIRYANDTLFVGAFNGANKGTIAVAHNDAKSWVKRPSIFVETWSSPNIGWDDFMAYNWTPTGSGDVTPPTINSYQLYPADWDTSTSGYIETRVTDAGGIDSIYIRWNSADSLIVKCGNTTDTTVRRNIAKKPAGTYTYNVRAVDKSLNVTTATNKAITVYTSFPDTSAPVVVNYYVTPDIWDTTAGGSITVRVTDNRGIDSLYIRFNGADSLRVKFNYNVIDTTITRVFQKKSAGTYTYNVRVVDKAGNVTNAPNKQFTVVAKKDRFKGMIAWLPTYHINAEVTTNSYGNTYSKIGVANIPYRRITHLVWMVDYTTWSTSAPYFLGSTMSGNAYDNAVLTGAPYTGRTTNYYVIARDSCNKAGVRLLLGVCALGNYGGTNNPNSQGGILDQIAGDSAALDLALTQLYNYVVARGFDGVVYNWEFPRLDNGERYLRLLRMTHRKFKAHNPPLFVGNCVNRSGAVWSYPRPTAVMDEYVDVNMPMLYGLSWSSVGGFNSNLHPKACFPDKNTSIDSMLNRWIGGGLYNSDKGKFAGAFTGEALRIYATSPCNTKSSSSTEYYSMYYMIGRGVSNFVYDSEAKATYVMDGANAYISNDYYHQVPDKINYYANKGLGWLWYWDLGRGIAQPDAQHTVNFLIDSIYKYTNGYDVPPFPVRLLQPSNGATNVQSSGLIFRWNKSTLSVGYNIRVYKNAVEIINTTVSDTTYTPNTGLITNDGSTYTWVVTGVSNINVVGDPSLTFSFTTIASGQLSTPNLISPSNNATNLHPDSVVLRWNRVNNALHYVVNVSTDTNFNTIVVNSNTIDTLFAVQAGVFGQGIKYFWRIRAWGEFPSDWSIIRSYTTRIIVPSTSVIVLYNPQNNVTLDSNKVTFMWQRVPNRKYNLVIRQDTLASNYLVINKLFDTVYTSVMQHIPGTFYWRVETIDDTIKSEWRKYNMNLPVYADTSVSPGLIVYDMQTKRMKFDIPRMLIIESTPNAIPTPPPGYYYLFVDKQSKRLMLMDSNRNIIILNQIIQEM